MKKQNKLKKNKGAINYIILVLLIVYSISLIVMLAWGLLTSLKTINDFQYNKFNLPKGIVVGKPGEGPLLYPWQWAWSNFGNIIKNFDVEVTRAGKRIAISMIMQFVYTIMYAGGCAAISVFVTTVMSYLVTKFDYALSKVIYTFVVVSMVIPVIGTMPATLTVLNKLKLYDTFFGIYIMNFTFSGMYFLIFCGIFSGISNEYSEAAYIDGASELRVLFRIMFPLVMPTCATVFLIQFINLWNDYNTSIVYMPSHPTLARGVFALRNVDRNGFSSEPMRLAGCMILAIPITAIFIAFKEKIMENVTMGGVKE